MKQHEPALLNLPGQFPSYLLFLVPMLFYGEGDGTPLQYSCLENPMDGGAWLAVVHGVAKTRTRLKQLSSSSSSSSTYIKEIEYFLFGQLYSLNS